MIDRHAATTASLRRLPWSGIGWAAVCICAYNLSFFAGVRACGVAIGTAVALGSGPVWAGLLQAILTKALPTRSWWMGTAIAVAGVVAIATGGGVSSGVSAGVLAIVVVGERPGWVGTMGLAAVLTGLWVVVSSELRPGPRLAK